MELNNANAALVFTTTPHANVSTPRTNVQLINVTTGEVLADLDHELFTAGYEIVGDNVFRSIAVSLCLGGYRFSNTETHEPKTRTGLIQ